MILYRPVGLQELELIYDSGMTAFPARLPQQPIFYPVLQLEYARQIASNWNAKNGQLAGYVTQFKMEDQYIDQFEQHSVGGTQYQELWIPTEGVVEFNRHILGHIKVVEAHFGDAFKGFIPEKFGLQGKNAVEQFTQLANTYIYKRMDFYLEIKRNHKAVFLNYPFWLQHDFKNPSLKEKILQALREAWSTSFPKIPLANPVREDTLLVKSPSSSSIDKPAPKESAPAKQADSPSLVTPVRKDTPAIQPTDSHSLVDFEDEDPMLEEETESESSVEDFDEDADTTFIEQTDSYDRVETDDEELDLIEQTDTQSSAHPVQVDNTLVKQTDSHRLAEPIHEEIRPAKPVNPPFLTARIQNDTPPVKQTATHFVQGIKLGLSGMYPEAIEELLRLLKKILTMWLLIPA